MWSVAVLSEYLAFGGVLFASIRCVWQVHFFFFFHASSLTVFCSWIVLKLLKMTSNIAECIQAHCVVFTAPWSSGAEQKPVRDTSLIYYLTAVNSDHGFKHFVSWKFNHAVSPHLICNVFIYLFVHSYSYETRTTFVWLPLSFVCMYCHNKLMYSTVCTRLQYSVLTHISHLSKRIVQTTTFF